MYSENIIKSNISPISLFINTAFILVTYLMMKKLALKSLRYTLTPLLLLHVTMDTDNNYSLDSFYFD